MSCCDQMYSEGYAYARDEAADEIEHWKNEASKKDAELTIARNQLETERRTVETMDNNHRSMASLLADTGRERDKLAKQLVRAEAKIKEYEVGATSTLRVMWQQLERERCAQVAETISQSFLSTEYAANQPLGSFCERFACDEVAKAIRAQTDDVREEPGYTQYTSFRP